ncbi:MAG: heavy metal-binding domain-containing protein [Acidimicrobiia bacterium]
MTQEGRVEDFWTTKRRDQPVEDNVRPLLKALAAARRSLDDEHQVPPVEAEEALAEEAAIVVDIRPAVETVAPQAPPVEAPPATEDPSPPARPVSPPPDWIMIEPPPAETEAPAPVEDHPAPEWGDLWRESVQGWVREEDGTKVWRPIVTTTTAVPNWEIDTNLGMVTGESACALDEARFGTLLRSRAGADSLRQELADDRRRAQEAMVREAVARGAHAVIGVNLDYTPVGECLIVTATGTAVTLRTAG